MNILRYIRHAIAVFLAGAGSFLLILTAIAAFLCLLSVGLACAVFTLGAATHLFLYLMLHDQMAGHIAVRSILIAAGCFGAIVLFFSSVMDLFNTNRLM